MIKNKRSFFEKLTGAMNIDDEDELDEFEGNAQPLEEDAQQEQKHNWMEEENEEGQLMVDLYQSGNALVMQAMIAGVDLADLTISINREMVTIEGTRRPPQGIPDEDYFYRELYWGAFSRTILLPQEVEPEEAEALEKNGLLTLRLPKIDKEKTRTIRVKSTQ